MKYLKGWMSSWKIFLSVFYFTLTGFNFKQHFKSLSHRFYDIHHYAVRLFLQLLRHPNALLTRGKPLFGLTVIVCYDNEIEFRTSDFKLNEIQISKTHHLLVCTTIFIYRCKRKMDILNWRTLLQHRNKFRKSTYGTE